MTLSDYMTQAGLTRADVAGALAVSQECVRLWELGERTPRPVLAEKISDFTNGKVTANDFVKAASAKRRAAA